MLKFYFHIRDGEHLVCDEEGLALRDWPAVKLEGYKSALDVALELGCQSSNCSIEVVDQFGKIVDRVIVRPLETMPC